MDGFARLRPGDFFGESFSRAWYASNSNLDSEIAPARPSHNERAFANLYLSVSWPLMLLLKPSCSIPHFAAGNGEVCCIESVYDCAFASRKTRWSIPDFVRQVIRRSGSPKSAN